MNIEISNFRSINSKIISIPNESISLLSGSSGSGKSTIVNAIYWCLYGTLRNVRNFGDKNKKCYVKIYCKNFTITRSKSPEEFLFEDDHIKLQNDEAQNKINEIFGSKDVWLSSSYLAQGMRNNFLVSNSETRLNILTEISFNNEDPDVIMTKIESELENKNKIYLDKHNRFSINLENYKKKRKELDIKSSDNLTENEIEYYRKIVDDNDTINVLEEKVLNLEKINTSNNIIKNQRERLNKLIDDLVIEENDYEKNCFEINQKIILYEELLKIEKLLEQKDAVMIMNDEKIIAKQYDHNLFDKVNERDRLYVKIFNDENIDIMNDQTIEAKIYDDKILDMISERDRLRKEIELAKNKEILYDEKIPSIIYKEEFVKNMFIRDNLKKELNELENKNLLLDNDIEENQLDHELLRKVNIRDEIYKKRKDICNRLKVENDQCIIVSIQKKLKNLLYYQPLLKKLIEKEKCEDELLEIDEKINELNKYKYILYNDEIIEEKRKELLYMKELLICPNCNVGLRYSCKKLHKEDVFINNDQIKIIEENISFSEKYNKLKREREDLNQKLEIILCEIPEEINWDEIQKIPLLKTEDEIKIIQKQLEEIDNYLSTFEIEYPNESITVKMIEKCDKKYKLRKIEREYEDLLKIVGETNLEDVKKTQLKCDLLKIKFRLEEIEKTIGNITKDLIKKSETKYKLLKFRNEYDILLKETENIGKDSLKFGIKKYELLELKKRYDDLRSKIGNVNLQELYKFNEYYKNKRREQLENKEKLKIYKNELEQLVIIDINEDPKDIRKEIDRMKDEKILFETKLKKWDSIKNINEEKRDLENDRNLLINLEKNIQNLSNLKFIGNEVFHITMQSVLETINNFINELLLLIFDHPITVKFDVYKILKTGSRVKPSINMKILYKGFEIESLNTLSGGEADRISLAVTLALSKFSSCPFILLDEFASGLDVNTKESVIKSIRSVLDNKTVICISHDTVEGIYDHVQYM